MEINITDLNGNEIIQILTNYPRGRLVIKNDSVFWDSVNLEPAYNKGAAREFDPRQPPKGQGQIGDRFEKMADTLGRMVC